MGYKSILTVLTDINQQAQLDAALAIAQHEDAHLEVFCLAVDHTQTGFYYAGASAYVFQEAIDKAIEDAKQMEDWVRERLGSTAVRFSVDSAVAQVGGLSTLVGMKARFSDLVVLGRPYNDDRSNDREAVVEASLFEGCCPVLIMPAPLSESFGKRILVAWNQSGEALAAIRRAMPFLRQAEHVEVTVIDPSPYSPERAEPGQALAQMLVRHGVKAEVAVLAKTRPLISEIISQRATEIGADMIVMGAYGHSRLRQAILGGATRNTLEHAEIPVFMAR